MDIYKNNTTDYYVDAESVYLKTIDFENSTLGDFYIKRDGINIERTINHILYKLR